MTRFFSLFDTLTWDEKPVVTALARSDSAPSSEDTQPSTKITRVRTERTFHALANAEGATFEGTGISEYTMVYAPTVPGAGSHEVSADYGGVILLEGTFTQDGVATQGSVVLAVLRGSFGGGVAKAEWMAIDGTLRGSIADKCVAKGIGGYTSAGMTDCEAWFELELKA